MCLDPATASLMISTGSAGAGVLSQMQGASSAARTIGQQVRNRIEETNAQASQRMGERAREARRERGRMITAAGESGVSGQSFENALMDSFTQQNMDAGTMAMDARFGRRAAIAEGRSALSYSPGASPLDAGLQIAGGVMQGYTTGLQIKGAQRAAADGG